MREIVENMVDVDEYLFVSSAKVLHGKHEVGEKEDEHTASKYPKDRRVDCHKHREEEHKRQNYAISDNRPFDFSKVHIHFFR